MSGIITSTIANRLRLATDRYKASVHVPAQGAWKAMGDGQLWAAVLGQIAVVGGAKSGDQLAAELGDGLEAWYVKLKATNLAARRREIHRRYQRAGVRYVTANASTCKKTNSAVYDFELLESYGGPRRYFANLSQVPVEAWRIGIVSDEMTYIRHKGARDLLIGLGLVEDAVAFDSRLQAVLKNLGAELPADLATNRVKYKMLEQELIAKVCIPCGVTGGHLDRILFRKWKEIE